MTARGEQASAGEPERLHAELVSYVDQRRRLVRAQRVRGHGARAAYVLVDGTEAWASPQRPSTHGRGANFAPAPAPTTTTTQPPFQQLPTRPPLICLMQPTSPECTPQTRLPTLQPLPVP